MSEKEIFIGVGGTNCSGKDTAADYLATNLNLYNVSLADILRVEATYQGMPHDRESLIEVSKNLPKDPGGIGALALRALDLYEGAKEKDDYSGLLIGSIRCTVDAEAISQNSGTIIFVDAPAWRRYSWSQNRQREGDQHIDFRSFLAQDDREFFGVGDPYQPNQNAIKNMAHYVIDNESSVERLKSNLLAVAEQIKLKST